jgi:hypothetical protein
MIEQAKDVYAWRVTYHNGLQLNEEDAAQGFASVDQLQVKRLRLLDASSGIPVHIVTIPQGATPIFFRRRSIELNPNTDEQAHKTVHCIGWKKGDEAVYLFIFEDGSTLLTNNLQAV